ncbi:MAG: 50S ribosomal protein L18Ae [archaeon]
MKYEVSGKFSDKRGMHLFCMVVDQPSEKLAGEKIYTHFGSKHRIKRNFIKLEGIKQVKNEKKERKAEA